ncbi:MAG: hypothetical protein DMG40_00325 [Acidobacteria bacterium]|nr:MAG: hypothetical protein DMG40_00325 [Acidobacteriota bacterium]
MRYEWDERKRKDFLDAPRVFGGATLTVADDRQDYGEERFITFGLLRDTVVAIAHTEHPKTIRIISMRKATRHEEKSYFAEIDYRLEADSKDEG